MLSWQLASSTGNLCVSIAKPSLISRLTWLVIVETGAVQLPASCAAAAAGSGLNHFGNCFLSARATKYAKCYPHTGKGYDCPIIRPPPFGSKLDASPLKL